ncbi:MAG: hypothetical protein MUF87_19650 [Anaerolineae bacterium]|jgi:hypothetical protein|nr:hypothetical protein [Anaerolineae bacterium]
MSETNYSIEQDLREAIAMVDSLERYVQQDQLYGTVGSGGIFSAGNMPKMTIGGLLMRLRRLQALSAQLDHRQRDQFTQSQTRHEQLRKEWRVHYTEKMLYEANSRLDAMRTFFEECSNDPKLCARVYQPEVLRRTIAEEILIAAHDLNLDIGEISKKARATDSRLRRFTAPSDFVWGAGLETVYPADRFWWMYHRPPMPA